MIKNIIKATMNLQKISRIKVFDNKKLVLFVTGIIVISILSSSVTAFSNGFNEKQVLIESDPNTLIITQPGASTPVTSRVFTSLGNDLEFVEGITSVYPETLSLCSVKQSITTVHGVSNDFANTLSGFSAGSWLYNDSNANDVESLNQAVVGSVLAQKLKLKVGDSLLVSSTVTDVFITLDIAGILLKQKTPVDEQLLVALPIGRLLSSLQPYEVSFLRVQFDTARIEKANIQTLLEQEHSLSISVMNEYFSEFEYIHDYFSVQVRTMDDVLIKQFQLTTAANGTIAQTSKLPFGRYRVQVHSPYLEETLQKSITLTNKRDITFSNVRLQEHYFNNTNPIVLEELHVNVKNSQREAIKDPIPVKLESAQHENLTYNAVTDTSGQAVFYDIETGLYNISTHMDDKDLYSYQFISEDSEYIDIVFSKGEISEENSDNDLINLNKWHGYRKYSVNYSNEFADSFFSRTLNIVKLSVISLTMIVFALSLMSITTATRYPLLTSMSTIKSLKLIGTSNSQIMFVFLSQLTLLGGIGTVIGIVLSFILLNSIQVLRTISIAGIIIEPEFNLTVVGIVLITNLVMIVLASFRKMKGIFKQYQYEGIPI